MASYTSILSEQAYIAKKIPPGDRELMLVVDG